MRYPPFTYLSLLFAAHTAFAAETYNETQSSWEKWRDGTFENVVFARPDQGLMLGQSLSLVAEFEDMIIWKSLIESSGSLLLSTGGDQGALWRVSKEGGKELIFEADQAFIRALAKGQKGESYFATSPSGAIYVLKPGKAAEVFAQLPAQFIWDMQIGPMGDLYVATGNPAAVYKIPATGLPDTPLVPFFIAPDASALTAIAIDKADVVYAGTGNMGILYAIASNGKGTAIASTGGEEITAIVPAAGGAVYFSTFKEKVEVPNPLDVISAAIQSASNNVDVAKAPNQGQDQEKGAGFMSSFHKMAFGALYRVDASGFIEGQWGVREAGIFSLVADGQDGFYVGTSSRGKVFCITDAKTWRLVAQVPTGGAITSLAMGTDGSGYILSSNPARVYALSPQVAAEGSFISTVFDAEQASRYGIAYGVTDPLDAFKDLSLESRTGNVQDPDSSWSPWAPSNWGERLACPNGRYFQYKIKWANSTPSALSTLRFFYTYPNRPPVVRSARISLLGVQVQVQDIVANRPLELKNFLQEGGLDSPTDPAAMRRLEMRATGESGFMTCAWDAEDPNGDYVSFTVELQSANDSAWVTLVKDLSEPIYSFNARGLAEGYYRLRITATDAPSNRPQDALTGSFVTPPFVIDTSAPLIALKDKKVAGDKVTLRFIAEDTFSPLWSAHYALDGDIPCSVTPDDGFFDGLKKSFTLEFTNLSRASHSLLLSVQDEWGNTSSCAASFETSG